MPENQMTPEQKEARRQDELAFLKSKAVTNLYVAAQGRSVARFGEDGEDATISSYMAGLDSRDKHVGRITTSAFARDAAEQAQLGKDPRKYGAALPSNLLDTANSAYQSAINYVKVSDVIGLLGFKDVHQKRISQEQMDMYMEDFAKTNPDAYKQLVGVYFGTAAREGVGNAQVNSARATRSGLEKMLQSDPDVQNQ